MNRVRFHLAHGENYMRWQVSQKGGGTKYVCPLQHQIVMRGCRLRNRRSAAEQIYCGANKTVCAWVECDEVEIVPVPHSGETKNQLAITYNPRTAPYWVDEDSDADDKKYAVLFTRGRGIFKPAE